MPQIIKTTFQLRRGTAERWALNNPVLERGEPGFEIDTNRLKIGNGETDWNNLEYIGENGNSGVFNVNLKEELPSLGDANLIYKVESEAKLYQWNTILQDYEALTDGVADCVIEKIKIAGSELEVDEDRSVNIPVAGENFGVVKSSDADNSVLVNEDGTMSVNNVNVNKLIQDSNSVLILYGGSATDNII